MNSKFEYSINGDYYEYTNNNIEHMSNNESNMDDMNQQDGSHTHANNNSINAESIEILINDILENKLNFKLDQIKNEIRNDMTTEIMNVMQSFRPPIDEENFLEDDNIDQTDMNDDPNQFQRQYDESLRQYDESQSNYMKM